jgi:hypothetical protein
MAYVSYGYALCSAFFYCHKRPPRDSRVFSSDPTASTMTPSKTNPARGLGQAPVTLQLQRKNKTRTNILSSTSIHATNLSQPILYTLGILVFSIPKKSMQYQHDANVLLPSRRHRSDCERSFPAHLHKLPFSPWRSKFSSPLQPGSALIQHAQIRLPTDSDNTSKQSP